MKEVANHANDIMKQGVRAYKEIRLALLTGHVANVQLFFLSQDNFQKLIQVQCRLIGNHEIVQPGRVRRLQVFFFTVLFRNKIHTGRINIEKLWN